MKIEITEKQLHLILSTQKDIDEQETASTNQSGGYPEVGKWESGVVRGPANQVTNTKWSDTVGSQLKRGKANMLK
jgi:hypothetical protein